MTYDPTATPLSKLLSDNQLAQIGADIAFRLDRRFEIRPHHVTVRETNNAEAFGHAQVADSEAVKTSFECRRGPLPSARAQVSSQVRDEQTRGSVSN